MQCNSISSRSFRLAPPAFPELPANLVQELHQRGCTIPQETYGHEPHNVIKGEFARHGQMDWAVLCSVKGVSTILVFWNASARSSTAVGSQKDLNYVQDLGRDQIGYSKRVNAVDRAFIMRHYLTYGGQKPPVIDHQGIDDAFVEKGSTTWYFTKGKWLQLTGSD